MATCRHNIGDRAFQGSRPVCCPARPNRLWGNDMRQMVQWQPAGTSQVKQPLKASGLLAALQDQNEIHGPGCPALTLKKCKLQLQRHSEADAACVHAVQDQQVLEQSLVEFTGQGSAQDQQVLEQSLVELTGQGSAQERLHPDMVVLQTKLLSPGLRECTVLWCWYCTRAADSPGLPENIYFTACPSPCPDKIRPKTLRFCNSTHSGLFSFAQPEKHVQGPCTPFRRLIRRRINRARMVSDT